MESVWLLLGSGAATRPGRSVWVFLARGCFAAKTPDHVGWISLDFLGFSRPNRDFSMGYAGFSGKNFSRALCGGGRAPERAPAFLGCRSPGLFIGQAYPSF